MSFLKPRNLAGIASALSGAVLLAGAVHAEDAQGRYTMTPTEEGFVRLDTQTGAMSLCGNKDGAWTCRAMPDDQKALQDKLARLEEENRSLKSENQRLEDVLGLGPKEPGTDGSPVAPGEQGPPSQTFKLPSEKDVDKAFDYFEGILKKFQDRLKKLEQKEKGANTVPL